MLEEKGVQLMMPEPYQGPNEIVKIIPHKTMCGVKVELIQPAGKFDR
ncbi:MAG: hypothetical protein SWK76_17515 [Actinomycetota bacterium]|nr:hypothetical protein [Actinomycetota bacterium]